MQTFDSDGVEIAFMEEGEGEPVLLIHGFASNVTVNWIRPGWVAALTRAGRRVVAFDHRGHGASQKLYDKDAYRVDILAEDALRLLDHLGIGRADIIGYSMGSRTGALVAANAPERVRALVLGGVGMNLVTGVRHEAEVAAALLAEDPASVTEEPGRGFRRFADRTHGDRRALAACMLSPRVAISSGTLARIMAPTLVINGADDTIATEAEELVAMIPDARLIEIPGRDHMTVVGDPRIMAAAIDFLAGHA